jgi:beta-aspartyl-peptidase (threonine type)
MNRLIIHGGAGSIAPERRPAYLAGLRAALHAGMAVLEAGGDAVEAVLVAVEQMERNRDAFNAGVGGSPNRDGEVELDACVMRGADGSSGAVAAVRTAPSAVRLADWVRTDTPHVMLVGPGADAHVQNPVDPASLLTPYTRDAWERWRAGRELEDATQSAPQGSATVGAVALAAGGELAAATSTGGMLGKWPGRVGDAPIVGAGTYADHRVGVSTTGYGEAFVRAVTAKAIAERLAHGGHLPELLERGLAEVRSLQGKGGIIALGADGEVAYAFDTPNMAVAWSDGVREQVLVLEGPEAEA